MTTSAQQAKQIADLPLAAEADEVTGGGIKVPESPRSGAAPVPFPPGPSRTGE
jgi:hypothetical protein